LAYPDEPQRGLTFPALRDAAAVLALFAAICVALLGAYVVATAPGASFPRAETKSLTHRDFSVSKGSGRLFAQPNVGEALVVLSTDETGIAVVSAVTDVRSADYPIVAWRAEDLADDADVRMLWRTDVAPTRLNSIKLQVAAGGLVPVVVARDANWIGRVSGVALVIRGPLADPPPRIFGVTFRPGGIPDALREVVGGWFSFERWSGASINTRSGGADVQALPLSPLLVVATVLTGGIWYAWTRRRGHVATWPLALAAVFVAAWIVLDVQWIANLSRQVAQTRAQFGGKDWQARHEAAEDAEVFKFIERVRGKLPATPARVFMLSDAAPLRGRGAYYLYPHNVLFDPLNNTLPQVSSLRAGDYVVVYHRRGVQYNREARRLRFEGGDSVQAELIMSEPGAGVFRIG
jgi:hypothetical protein